MAIYSKMTDLKAELNEAINTKDSAKFLDVVNATAQAKAESILEDAVKGYDNNILAARGNRQLTSKETNYYNALISAMQQRDFKNAVSNIESVLPQTVIEDVFAEIEKEHAVLRHLDVQHVNAKTRLVFGTSENVEAAWTTLNGKIEQEVAGAFEEIEVAALKLTAYIPVPESMLALGPVYLDRFVRTILFQSIANGIEKAVINNLTTNTGPIGMVADLEKGTTASGKTTYTIKTAQKVTAFTPKGLAPVLSKMAKDRSGNPRVLNGLFLIVNPTDYYTTIRPAVCVQNGLGEWVEKMPVPIEIVQSTYMAEGKAVLGLDNKYIVAACTSEAGNIEQSDDFDFLNDNRTYKIKLYANGLPKDNNAFQYLDITDLEEAKLLTLQHVVAADTE